MPVAEIPRADTDERLVALLADALRRDLAAHEPAPAAFAAAALLDVTPDAGPTAPGPVAPETALA